MSIAFLGPAGTFTESALRQIEPDPAHHLPVASVPAALAAVRREAGPEMICQVTTEAVGLYSPAEQMAAMRALKPEAFSVALRELFTEPEDEAAYRREMVEDIRNQQALRRRGTPEEQAAAIAFLASEDASFITGQVINCSGGQS